MLHGKFDGFDAVEGVLYGLGIVFLEEFLESLSVDGVLGEQVRDWSLVSWNLVFGRDFGGHWSVVAAKLGFCLGDLDGGVGFYFKFDSLPGRIEE